MKLQGSASSVNGAPTIDDIDASQISELVGYWKCSDVAGGVIPDHSGNGYDLSMTYIPGDTTDNIGDYVANQHPDPDYVIEGDGFVAPNQRRAFSTDVTGTLLDTGGNYIIYAIETLVSEVLSGSTDFDYLGAMMVGHPPNDAAARTGLQFAGFGITGEARLYWQESGSDRQLNTSIGNAAYNNAISGDRCSMVAGFKPSTSLVAALNIFRQDGTEDFGFETDTTPNPAGTIPSTLPLQNDLFGIRATTGGSIGLPVKNIQVWSFPSEPVYMDETIQWISKNPGRIPPWWIR